jgi:hypothetical protein
VHLVSSGLTRAAALLLQNVLHNVASAPEVDAARTRSSREAIRGTVCGGIVGSDRCGLQRLLGDSLTASLSSIGGRDI